MKIPFNIVASLLFLQYNQLFKDNYEFTKQRDLLTSMLTEADLTILELKDKLKQYEDSKTECNVISIERRK